MALVGGLAAQLLPLLERHPRQVADWLSARAQRPVAFDALQTRWTRRGPLLRLRNLRIGGGNGVAIGDAEVLVSQYAGLLPGRSFTELRLRGLALTLRRDRSGRWQVGGLPGQQAQGDPLDALERLGELQLIGATVTLDAPQLRLHSMRLTGIDLRLRASGDRLRIGLRMERIGARGALDFDRRRGHGRLWLSARPDDLGRWSSVLRLSGVAAVAGRGRIQAWMRLDDHRFTAAVVDVDLSAVSVGRSVSGADGRVLLGRVEARGRWRRLNGEDWRLDAERLRIGEGRAEPLLLDGLALTGGQRWALAAKRIEVGPILRVLALADPIAPAAKRWLAAARPGAQLRDVEVAAAEGRLRARAAVSALRFAPVGDSPGVSGLSGRIEGDADGMVFEFDSRRPATLQWPRGFGVDHLLHMTGSVVGWREGSGWKMETPALHLFGGDYSADLRGGLWFQGDGSRPRIDLAARLGPAPVTAARKFWLRHLMPVATVRWLDAALVGGTVLDGRALVSGDLDDWPFTGDDGLFQASARLVDAVVRFQPDWPAAERLQGEIDFIGNGFDIRGAATLGAVPVARLRAGIADFSDPVLKVWADARSDADALLALLGRSPLRARYGQALGRLQASGPARVGYRLELPLRASAPVVMDGRIGLDGVRLEEREWKLVFEPVRGEAHFDQDGFVANDLQVRHADRPGRLSLRAGAHAEDRRHAFEAELSAPLAIDALLDRAPDLAWLKSRTAGVSDWSIALALPGDGDAGTPAVGGLSLRSDLRGTVLTLPAPLHKPAGQSLATTVRIGLPLASAVVDIGMSGRAAIRTRKDDAGRIGMRIAFGAERADGEIPAGGIAVGGHSESLDVVEWAGLARALEGAAGEHALSLHIADLVAGRLRLLGADFPDVRLRAVRTASGTDFRLDGATLAGRVHLPHASEAAIRAELERLHWQVAAGRDAAAISSPAATIAAEAVDPGRIPALQITVADLRFGDARLGSARLQTRRLADGMRIEHLQARTDGQSITIGGHWRGIGADGATVLEAHLRTRDIGALLAGFGFGNQMSKGSGDIRLQAHWSGGPARFDLTRLRGRMRLDLRNGQLVAVEPGAGRVLGLLSLTRLPRRLLLDFRDFFDKGLAFNTIRGDIAFGDGRAGSDNMKIDGPAAQIDIRGVTDLAAQTYDQTIDVYPRTGNLLTVAGALAGGPVGAAIGAAANAVLNKPLGNIGAKRYRVTGPWKAPKVEVLGRQQAGARTRADTAARPAAAAPADTERR